MMFLTGTRYVTAMYFHRRELILLFSSAAVLTFFLTYKAPLSFLALLGALLGTFGSFQKSNRIMRLCFICGNTVWLIHNLRAGSPIGSVIEASFLISNVLGYLRFHSGKLGPTDQQSS